MEIHFVPASTKEQLARIKEIYEEAFPENEKKPFSMLVEGQKKGLIELLAAEDGPAGSGCLVGEAILSLHEDVVLLEYFAVAESFRGRGAGSRMLQSLRERYRGQRLILEIESTGVESENREQRLARKRFYERNGMNCLDYSVSVMGVEMEMLSFGSSVGYEEYHAVYEKVYGAEFGAHIRPAEEIR